MKAVNDHLSLTLFTCPMIDTINCNCMGARTPQHPPFTSVTWVLVTDSGVLFGLIFVVGSLPCSKGFLPSRKPEFLNFTSVCHHCKFLFPFFSFFFFYISYTNSLSYFNYLILFRHSQATQTEIRWFITLSDWDTSST